METIINVFGVLLIVMGIFLVISVLMQSSKNHRVSGSIAGGAETFFGKQKGKTLDAMFNKLTTVVTIIFVIIVLALCFILPTAEQSLIENYIDKTLVATFGEEIKDVVTVDDYKFEGENIVPKDKAALENKINSFLGISAVQTPAPETETAPEGTEAGAEGTEAGAEGAETGAEGTEAGAEGAEAGAEGAETGAEGAETAPEGTETAPEGTETAPEDAETDAEDENN